MDSGKKHQERPSNPLYKANICSKLTLAWTIDIFKKGSKRDLELNDLFMPTTEQSSNILGNVIEENWNKEVERAAGYKIKPSFLRVLCNTFGLQLFLLGMLLAVTDITLKVLQPLFLARLLTYYNKGSPLSKQEAYLYAFGLILCSALQTIILQPFWMSMFKLGMTIRVSCCSLLYRKALRLSQTALRQTTVGQIINLMTNDVSRLDMCVLLVNYLWVGPLLTIIITYFLWLEIGPSALIGVAALLVFIPVLMWLGKQKSVFRLKTAKCTDNRIFLMNEIITAIKVIKMYCWEQPFANLVSQVRKTEIKKIRCSSYIEGIMLSFLVFHSRFAMFCSIMSYIAFGNIISASVAYVVTSYFSILRTVMSDLFPLAISSTAEALISIQRLQELMNFDETSTKKIEYQHSFRNFGFVSNGDLTGSYKKTETFSFNKSQDSRLYPGSETLVLRNATAKWREDIKENTLKNINIRIKQGELVVIIGPVGCGKSSLLNVMLKELPLQSGDINLLGVVSYASQEPWIFGESVRQNIIYDSPFDKVRYKQVIQACALKRDFEQFPFGDKTLVGDRGVILSGGQRARINLARAIYKKADLYLLDDPLSAVDTAVGKHLFQECITGYLEGKTCILVTHQLQYLHSVEHIIVLNNGAIKAEGSYQEILSSSQNFITHHNIPSKALGENKEDEFKNQYSTSSVQDDISITEQEQIEETRQRGKLQGSVLKTYLLSGGHWCVILLVFLMFVFTQFVANAGDYWLNYWVNLQEYVYNINNTASGDSSMYFPIIFEQPVFIIGYSALIATAILICLLRSFTFFYICLQSSIQLHNILFTSITRTAMQFFNTNPSGRILNRFTKDISSIDETVPSLLFEVLQISLDLIGIISIVMIVNIWLIFPTFLIVLILYVLRQMYMKTAQSVKRLEGIARSPVVSHINASLQGLTTIRAFKSESILQREFDNHQDLHTSAWFFFIVTRRAFGYCTDVICLIFISVVTISFLILDKEWLGGDVGLAITQSISITNFFQWGMKQSAELESNLTSVERVIEYCDLQKEPPLESTKDKTPDQTWPQRGRVEFSHVSLCYDPELPYVLKDLSFIIQPKEKIGIVGRTGAGKSSLINVLFRLADFQGKLTIDGINIATIGLHDLRSKLTIIPQEPILFSSSIRENLDPFNEYTDEVLWNALEEVQLKKTLEDTCEGLDWKVLEGGSNFSVGQRQLICLARAVIKNNKILVLDEATANVDHQTDALIQHTVRKKFLDSTVLTIAHRLHTVMDVNKILVIDNGHIVEYDHPYKLLSNKNSILYEMAQQTGKTTADTLYDMALKNYKSKIDDDMVTEMIS